MIISNNTDGQSRMTQTSIHARLNIVCDIAAATLLVLDEDVLQLCVTETSERACRSLMSALNRAFQQFTCVYRAAASMTILLTTNGRACRRDNEHRLMPLYCRHARLLDDSIAAVRGRFSSMDSLGG